MKSEALAHVQKRSLTDVMDASLATKEASITSVRDEIHSVRDEIHSLDKKVTEINAEIRLLRWMLGTTPGAVVAILILLFIK